MKEAEAFLKEAFGETWEREIYGPISMEYAYRNGRREALEWTANLCADDESVTSLGLLAERIERELEK